MSSRQTESRPPADPVMARGKRTRPGEDHRDSWSPEYGLVARANHVHRTHRRSRNYSSYHFVPLSSTFPLEGRDVMARPRFQALSWDDATRPRPGEPHAQPETPGARLVCRSTRWRESISP